MDLISESEFIALASEHGVGSDNRFPASRSLTFVAAPDVWRPWDMPHEAAQLPHFVEACVSSVTPGHIWYLYPRQGHWEFAGDNVPIQNELLQVIATGIGVPRTHRGAIVVGARERATLVAAMVGSLIFGWGTGEDLYAMPSDGGALLLASHHRQILGHFSSAAALTQADAAMSRAGYPDAGSDDSPSSPSIA